MTLIETINVNKKYKEHHALRDVNLRIDKGEVLALIGPTGAGKTTLLRLLDLLDLPTAVFLYSSW